MPRLALLAATLSVTALAAGACQRTEQASAASADCARVAETLTSFEVGSAASAEQRAPVVARHKAGCESTHTTAAEAACLASAKDTWAARACLPRMFSAPSNAGNTAANPGCATVGERMRAAVMTEVGSNGSAAATQLDKIVPVIQTACEQDGWPANVIKCMVDTKTGDMNAFQACANQLSPELQQKVQQRMTALLQQMQPPAPAAPSAGSAAPAAPSAGSAAPVAPSAAPPSPPS